MVNIPRALFTGRTGREPRYHVAIEELQDWAYTGNDGSNLVPPSGEFFANLKVTIVRGNSYFVTSDVYSGKTRRVRGVRKLRVRRGNRV
jgi:hypothetical protein